MKSTPPKQDKPIRGGLETPDDARKAQLSQVVHYSEFLVELASQRHTIVKSYTSAHPAANHHAETERRHEKLLDDLDALIRDVLSHIQVSDLRLDDPEAKVKA